MLKPKGSPPVSPSREPKTNPLTTNVTPTNPHEGTQLAEPTPQLDLPQRVDSPASIKTPARVLATTSEERVKQTVFSPHAASLRQLQTHIRSSFENGEEIISKLSACSTQKPKDRERAVSAKWIKEYTMLAESSKRAGRHDAECSAYLCLGILYDNAEDYYKAIDYYMLMLSISESTHHTMFIGLAANCIGVNYQLLSSGSKQYVYTGKFMDAQSHSLCLAIEYHTKHLEVTDDAGKFVAHLNLGLTHGSLGDPNEAARHHQEALRLAIQLNSAYGQSLAVGNLGLLASRQGDIDTATACMNQHLQLIQSSGDYTKAERAFDQAYRLAQEVGATATMKQCSCYLGVARARMHMSAYVAQLVSPLLGKATT